ncbi:Uncharacterized peptidase YqjE [hydrothermal vent metagenome]|uniref:Uncharacterized peptidase YqjE n=1 Tax=hydrothermal vent metagenome TaxID=652676 RepID=A0A3B1D6R0_9ZZZZ
MSTNKKNLSLPKANKQRVLKQVMELMAIPGKSCHEGKVVATLKEKILAAGIPQSAIKIDSVHKRAPSGGEVGSLIVKLPGTYQAPRRLMMAHCDTVPLCVGCRPVRKGDYIVSKDANTALGADDRAGVSVLLHALLEIVRHKLPHPPLTFFFVVQEEIGLVGAHYVNKKLLGNPAFCFNWDGVSPQTTTIGATGNYEMTIKIKGIASHAGAYPERGVNAIAIAGLAIADLVKNGWHGLIVKGKQKGTSNIGYVNAGEATNVVTPDLLLLAQARSHQPTFRKRIVREYEKAFTKAVKQVKNDTGQTGKVEFDSELKYESFCLKKSEPVVKVAEAAISAVNLTPETAISNGGLDANWMTQHGFPTVTIGCGQQNIHTVNERLHIEDYLNACRIGLILATGTES